MIDYNNVQQYRENNRIEAKLALGGLPVSLWETYSAFANTMGGVILLGVDEHKDKSLHPVDLPDPQKLVEELWSIVNDKTKISANILTPRNVSVQRVDNKSIIVIEVPRAGRFNRPVYINGDLYKGSYRRNGEGDYKCSPDEIESMLRDASAVTKDSEVIEEYSLNAIDFDSVRRYRDEVCRYRPNYLPSSIDRLTFLERIGAIHDGHPTAAGLLMFGKYSFIKGYFENYDLEYNSKDYSLSSSKGDWSGNVYDFYRQIKANLTVSNTRYSLSVKFAVLEAISNSLTNSDFYGGCGVSVFHGEKAILITNPGGFRINLKDAKCGGVSDPRNSNMTKMLNLIGGSEKMGSGIPEIFSVWKKEKWAEPILFERSDPLRISLYLPLTADLQYIKDIDNRLSSLKEKEAAIKAACKTEMIIEHLTYLPSAQRNHLITQLYISEDELSSLLCSLMEEGIVVEEEQEGNLVYKLKY